MKGYIKLHRCLLYSSVFNNPDLLRIWIWCLLKSAYVTKNELTSAGELQIKPGQFIFGRKSAAEFLKINESKFYRAMKRLESLGMLRLESKTKFTLATVINWDYYQGEEPICEQQSYNKRTDDEHYINNKRNKRNYPLSSPKRRRGTEQNDNSYNLELFERMLNSKD